MNLSRFSTAYLSTLADECYHSRAKWFRLEDDYELLVSWNDEDMVLKSRHLTAKSMVILLDDLADEIETELANRRYVLNHRTAA